MAENASFQTFNPTNLEPLQTYPYLSQKQLEQKIQSAHENWSLWRQSAVGTRKQYLLLIAQQLEQQQQALAKQMALEMGKPIQDGLAEVVKCIKTCEFYAEQIEKFLAPEEVAANYQRSLVQIESLGVIFCIMPWNFPLWQVIRFAIPALALGNTVLLKHSDITAGTAEIIESVFKSASEPQLFFNCAMNHAMAAQVLADPRVKAVSFTGSNRGGQEVAKTAGAHAKKSVLELGGSDAYLVLDDADLDQAVMNCVQGRLVNNGQSCVAAKRFFVPQKSLEAFVSGVESSVKKYVIGNPLDAKTQLGPLAQHKFKKDFEKSIQSLAPKVQRHLFLQNEPAQGAFINPQLMVLDMPVSQAHEVEFFGPLFLVFPYENEISAMEWINASPFGLGGAIFSRDQERALKLARNFQSGMVAINASIKSDPRLPFGGVKQSGYGRELGPWGFYEFANIKTIGIG